MLLLINLIKQINVLLKGVNRIHLTISVSTSVCTNPDCALRTKGETHKARNSLSALAIDLAGLSTVILGQPIPSFDPSFSESKTEKFETLDKAFCTKITFGPTSTTELQYLRQVPSWTFYFQN